MLRIISNLKNKKGFTLIELIVVLAVLAIILAIAVPRFIGIQKQARIDADYSTGALIAKAAELFEVREELEPDDAGDLIDGEYISDVQFQTKTLKPATPDEVKIEFLDEGAIIVTVNTGGGYQIYPRPTTSSAIIPE